ncbi:sulfatase [Devosia rhodophyticola]|uniref:Sulfatase n=1 Tax=Devosia rhodophyticola TaxID=3026423 RepID=A0ABY7YV61_9HYPH|nr:sulfatase [Devosia rhodophyticola]WDR05201.1 sulfatase [Devosia rhodophyticola]
MSEKPNIVMLLIDDLGWRDLGCYGSSFYETPNLDALAASGTQFKQAYASAPVCSPSRASMMSGKYPARVGITQYIGGHSVGELRDVPYFYGLPENEYSLARALGAGGYQTWHVGKWHLGDERLWPENHGFDVNIGGCARGAPLTYFSPYNLPTLTDGPEGEYLTDRLTDEAIGLVEQAGDQPFFLNFWHYGVHTPIEAPAELVAKYERKAEAMGLDVNAIEQGEPMTAWHLEGTHVQRRTVQSNPTYAAMMENLDTNIGRLVGALRRTGKLDNTLIIFTSDNGGLSTAEGSPTCNLPLAEGKGWMQDGGVRVPFIACWPGHVPPRTSDLVFTTPDIYPTLLGLAGIDKIPSQHVDGVDLWPQWSGATEETGRGPVYWHYPHYSNQGGTPGAAVRVGDFKLIRWFEDGRQALYNLADDIAEAHDLSKQEPARVAALSALLDGWSDDVMAAIPTVNPVRRGFDNINASQPDRV